MAVPTLRPWQTANDLLWQVIQVATQHAAVVAITVAASAVAEVAAVAVVVAVAVPTSMLRPWQTANNLL